MQDANQYRQYSDREHVLRVPDTYIGSLAVINRLDHIAVPDETGQSKIVGMNIAISEGVERLFLEVFSNALDNVNRSRNYNVDPGSIEVTMDATTIVVKNYGIPIAIQVNEQTGLYLPEMIFGNLRTSDNYNNNRTGAGRNGFGAKITNIFSDFFEVEIGNAYQQLYYKQTWYKNMEICERPIITSYTEGISYVKVTYKMDMHAVGYVGNSYTDYDVALFRKHVMDGSFTLKVPTSFNGEVFNFTDIREYVKRCSWIKSNNMLVHVEGDYQTLPYIEMCLIDTPDDAHFIAFTNGIINREGGVHVDAAYDACTEHLAKKINAALDEEASKSHKINKKDVKKHLSVIISCRLINPTYNSQSKTVLRTPKVSVKLEDKEIATMLKWDIVKRLYYDLEAKAFKELTKDDGKKRKGRHVKATGLEDANYAGTKDALRCMLMLTEGNSAMGYAVRAIKHIPGGRDYCGIYPLRGKPLNTLNASILQVASNRVIRELKTVIGLRESTDYFDDKNLATLRYGRVLIMADADEDGKHIIGLILTWFMCYYPSLIRRGYVSILRTPIVRASKGVNNVAFFTNEEFEQWLQGEGSHGKWNIKYLKGLGSSNPNEVGMDFQNPRYVQILYDDQAESYIKLAFDKKLADERKKWIAFIQEPMGVKNWSMLPISHFVVEELVEFARDNLGRSIPALMDGLKESQRKLLWAMFCKWGGCGRYEDGTRKIGKAPLKTAPGVKTIKVETFANFTQENTAYKHGAQNLCKAIATMTNSYPGANNLPYFYADGMFGTRNKLGQDTSQARYPMIGPAAWLPYMFRHEDMPLLRFKKDEGQDQEPYEFWPVIFNGFNGAKGIGSGHSTYIPNYNPEDIALWITRRLNGLKYQGELVPWYRGFTGSIELIETKGPVVVAQETESNEEEEGDEEIDALNYSFDVTLTTHRACRITGRVQGGANGSIEVVEIPIGNISTHAYEQFLKKMVEDGKLKDYHNKSDDNNVRFILYGYTGNVNLKDLHLISVIGLSNMVLLDESGQPKKYNSINAILEDWFNKRLGGYQVRKNYMLEEELKIIRRLEEKLRFVTDIVTENIVIRRRNKGELLAEIEQKGYTKDIYSSINILNLTADDITELENDINNHRQRYEQINSTRIEDMWLSDINEFLTVYKRLYK